MMSSQTTPSVSSLFKSAAEDGSLSGAAVAALNIVDIGQDFEAGLGLPADAFQSAEAILVTIEIDDSSSIRFVTGNTEAVREGHNMVLDALAASHQRNSILVQTRYLNGGMLFPYSTLVDAKRLDAHNYNPNGGTPLYDETLATLAMVVAKTQEFKDNGIPVRAVTVIVTDGHDESNTRLTPAKIATVVNDLLMTEQHIIAAMGISDGGLTDFRAVFAGMGIRDEWILTPGNTPSEIRKAFATVSSSAVRASQNATSFSQTAMTGFNQP